MKKDYRQIFKELVEREDYTLLSEYKGVMIKVKIRCNKGHVYKVTPNSFKNGRRCPKCVDQCPIQAKKKFLELLESEGCKLIGEYKNTQTKVKIKCIKGHEYNIKPNSFKQGSRCPICPTIQAKEQFIQILTKEGYELIGEYNNIQTKVKIRCDKGHEYNVIPNSFKQGCRCPKCANNCPEQAEKEFKELLNKEGYELIDEYKGSQKKIKIRCKEGHEYEVRPSNFKNMSQRCSKCAGLCPIQAKKDFIELVESVGYELIGKYVNVDTKVKIRCNKGHEYGSTTPNSFKQGSRCPKCAGRCPTQAKEQFIQTLDQEGYKLIGKYKNNSTKVKIRCPEGHLWETIPNNFKSNYCRCPHCEGSTGQRLLQEKLEEYNLGEVIYNDRDVLGGLELDIYYPELNIGIEYQGNYWHTLPDQIKRDKKKKMICEEKGIKLIEVWDDDFLKTPDKITKLIHNKITGLMTR